MAEGRGTARAAIWTAAIDLFVAHGYGGCSVRDIARAAGVDPALVLHYFGSKESLFLACMQAALVDQPVLAGPIDTFGEQLIRHVLTADPSLRGIFVALLRASDADGVRTHLRDVHETLFVTPLLTRLTGPDAQLRARLAGALVGGLLYALWVAGDSRLAATDPEEIVVRYGALLQALVDPGS